MLGKGGKGHWEVNSRDEKGQLKTRTDWMENEDCGERMVD